MGFRSSSPDLGESLRDTSPMPGSSQIAAGDSHLGTDENVEEILSKMFEYVLFFSSQRLILILFPEKSQRPTSLRYLAAVGAGLS